VLRRILKLATGVQNLSFRLKDLHTVGDLLLKVLAAEVADRIFEELVSNESLPHSPQSEPV
jgi:hypothetical protein